MIVIKQSRLAAFFMQIHMKKEIKIAVGIIVNPAQSEVFITQRQQDRIVLVFGSLLAGKLKQVKHQSKRL